MTYLDGLGARLAADGCEPQIQQWGTERVLVGRRTQFRLRWAATRLHLFVIAAATPHVTVEAITQFTAVAMDYALQNKGGLPVGFQTGVGVFPALIGERVDPAAAAWAAERQRLRFGCVARPVVVDLESGGVSQFRRTKIMGALYASYLRQKGELYFPAQHA